MYAIFRAKGKQFRAVPDRVIRMPTMDVEPGEKVTFDDVLLAERDGDVHVGAPSLSGASVEAEVLRHGRGEKIIVYKMKRRKGYRRKQGHRQGFTEIRIVGISFPKGKRKRSQAAERPADEAEPETAKAEEPEAREPVAEAAPVDEAAVETEGEAPAAAEEEIDITDAARALAEEHGLDLSTIEGTGVGGRILKGDVEKAIKAQES